MYRIEVSLLGWCGHWTSSIYLSIYVSISIYLSIYLSISIYLFINQSTDISIYLGLSGECIEDQGHYWVGVDTGHRLSIYLFLFIYLSIYLGLSGECIEDQGHYWVGVDIAPAMLTVAQV